MTDRRTRLARLPGLREQQHERAVAALQRARCELKRVEDHIRAQSEERACLQLEQSAAMSASQQENWMLARMEVGLYELEISVAMRMRQVKADAVSKALQQEAETRCASRQMEELLFGVCSEERILKTRREEFQLQEVSQSLRAFRKSRGWS